MALSRSMRACLHTGRLAAVALLASGGILLHFLVSVKIQHQIFHSFIIWMLPYLFN
jgi:hypothetical protein